MKNTFAKKFTVCALAGVLGFALTACDDSSSAGGDGGETSTKSSNSSSSSVTPSDVEGSSKTAWDYLNPDINYGEFTDERDGQVYKTVKIGDQIWMAQNLNYAYTGVKFYGEKYTSDSTSWCYENKVSNCDKYGRLYTWAAAIDSVKLANDADNPLDCGFSKRCDLSGKVQGLCPSGWHLPDTTEWNTLFTAVGGGSTAGTKLKSQTAWHPFTDPFTFTVITSEDTFGFSALPAGIILAFGTFSYDGDKALFWSSTDVHRDAAYYMDLDFVSDQARLFTSNYKNGGFSVRCVKDSE